MTEILDWVAFFTLRSRIPFLREWALNRVVEWISYRAAAQ